MKIFRIAFTVIVSLAGLFTVSAASTDTPQTTISLNGTWRFALAKNEQESKNLENFYLPEFAGKDFNSIPVPSNWAVLGYEEPVYRGFKDDKAAEGFYLHDFTIPKEWQGKRVLLHFGGIWSQAEVWLNGVYLGLHNGGYTSFALNVTGKLKETNRLAVRVRQVCTDYKFDVYDDWTIGGIYRDVTLEAMPNERWIDNVQVQTAFDSHFEDADMKLRIMVSDMHKSKLPGNYPLAGESYDLRLTLKDKDGNQVAQEQLTVPGHTSTDREIPLNIRVNKPHQWTAETPYLYNLSIELIEKGKVTHTRTERVGFRQISTVGGVFRINGQAVKLRGVNRHDEHPDVGRATTREHWLQDIKLMKAANINFIRLAHYAPAKGFIELCDEMGMYVGEEVSIGGAGDLMYDPSLSGATLQRAYETVKRDINNPSIIYWSVGNEDPLTSQHLAAVKLVKALDSTRPVLMPWRAEEWMPEEIDILAPHYWKPQEYDQLAGRATRPVISTEYTHAYGNEGMGGLEACWKSLTKYPAGTGAAVWMWADQGLKNPNPKEKKDLSDDKFLRLVSEGWDGIVDSYRNPTRDYWEVKSVYAQAYPTTDKVAFTPGQASVNIPIQNDFDFTNLSAIQLKWSIRENDKELAAGSGSVAGQPHSIAAFKLPMDKLKTIQAGKTYYVWLTFYHENGAEIIRRSVELIPNVSPKQPSVAIAKPTVSKEEDKIRIHVGNASYIFDSKTGHLVSAMLKNKTLITDISPVIWQKLDPCESTISGARQVRSAEILARYTASVVSWEMDDNSENVIINAKVKYTADENNQFTAAFRYTVGNDGRLSVHYEILTSLNIPWIPVVGMVVKSEPELSNIKWLGLGPYDAWPNKKSASMLGVWSGGVGSSDVVGNKSIRWVERAGINGGFRITGNNYMAHNASAPDVIFILSDVLGRPEKGRKADDSIPQLITNTKEPFVGEFSLSLY